MGRTPADCMHCETRPVCITARLASAELEAVEIVIRRRRVRPGTVLSTEGEVATVVRVLQAGIAFGMRRGVDGRSRPIGIAGRGTATGLFGVFGHPAQVSSVAAAQALVCEIPVRALADLAASNPDYSHFLSSVAVQSCGKIAAWSEAVRVRGINNQLAYTLLLLAQARESPSIELPTQVALSELLGTTRESVARGLGALEDEGDIVRLEGKRWEVRTERLLERLDRAAQASSRPMGLEFDG
jgi:CRP-like cAMP-binding protein